MSIEDFLVERGVQHLVHFTSTFNLLGIFEQGYIYPREKLDVLKAVDRHNEIKHFSHMDNDRADGYLHYVNTSVSHANFYVLDAYKRRKSDNFDDWCILKLDPFIAAWPGVLFSVCNASSREAKQYGVRQGLEGLEQLFQKEVSTKKRVFKRVIGMTRDDIPTDLQAEVLVPNPIAKSKILSVSFESKESLENCRYSFQKFGIKDAVSKFLVAPEDFKAPSAHLL